MAIRGNHKTLHESIRDGLIERIGFEPTKELIEAVVKEFDNTNILSIAVTVVLERRDGKQVEDYAIFAR